MKRRIVLSLALLAGLWVIRQREHRAGGQPVWPRLRLRRTFVLCTRAELL